LKHLLVQINGEAKELPDGTLLAELITQLDLPVQRVAVEVNREVVRRRDWQQTVLNEHDRIEIVHFVGGGCEGRIVF
jgi:thiamine biosynthesis protein ThiS